ncbi:MAG: carboxypeptidase-like regulatory domain-containing protein [Rhodopirellula sp. JB055]|uniref:carboxypeptidase-like regulatory domain-containing protein n=1 Tax=Rhodopirellula sp. JB055 TaxID=3342846 RepID=UPI00370C5C50
MNKIKKTASKDWNRNQRTRLSAMPFLLIGLIGVLSGCGPSGPEIAEVSGVVSMGGNPVPGASITFYPVSGRQSFGKSDQDGRYTLEYAQDQPGAVTGQHRVKIMTGGMGAPSMPIGPGESPSKSRTRSKGMEPPKEVTLSEMVTVESGSNEIDLTIPSS